MILMVMHFEAKKSEKILYIVLCVYKMVTIFIGDGRWIDFILHITFITLQFQPLLII